MKFHENDIELTAVCDEDEVRVKKAAEENDCRRLHPWPPSGWL